MKITIPKLKKYILLSLLALGLIIIFQTVFAQVTIPSQYKPEYAPAIPIKINGPNSDANFVNYLLQLIAGSLINIAAPVAILIIAVAGLLAVISHGNATLQGKVKKTIGGAVIGLLIIILSWVIIQTIITFALQATGNINSTPPPVSPSTTQSTSKSTKKTSKKGTSGASVPTQPISQPTK